MSWDLMAFKAPSGFKSPKDLPKSWEPETFASQTEVRAKLTELLPAIQFEKHDKSGALWGTYKGDGFSLEISLGETALVNNLWIAVRGDMKALAVVSAIVDAFGLRGVDLQGGEFFDPVHAQKSFAEWRNSVDRFISTRLKSRQDEGT